MGPRRKSSSSSSSGAGGGNNNKRNNKAAVTTTSSSTSSSNTNDHHAVAATGGGTVEQLSMLRSFLGMENNCDTVMVCGHLITESDLMDCHRKCDYNVQLAAERLMTGEYIKHMKQKSNNNNSSNRAIIQKSSSNISTGTSSRSSTGSSNNNPSKRKDPPLMTTAVKKTTNSATSTFVKAITPATTTKTTTKTVVVPSLSSNNNNNSHNKNALASNIASTTAARSCDNSSSSTGGHWLLCQRWISDAVCTDRSGRIQYQEILNIEHAYMSSSNNNKKTSSNTTINNSIKEPALPYVTSIRFRGTQHGVNGRLPDNIANLLTPLLRHDNSIITIHAQALMEMNTLVTGSEIPISITIYINKPQVFFQLFEEQLENNTQSSNPRTQFWESKKLVGSAGNNNNTTLQKSSGKRHRRMPLIQQAAFDLLQWAEYGDVPDFIKTTTAAPCDDDKKKNKTTTAASSSGASADVTTVDVNDNDPDGQDDDEDDEEENLVELSEADFEKVGEEIQDENDNNDDDEASAATAPPLPKDWGAGSDNAAAMLPETTEDPVGFKKGIRLCRPYQSQALYWMMQREKGVMMDNTNSTNTEPDNVMQEQMNLLSELVDTTKQQQHRPSSRYPQQQGVDVACECGPVLLSEKAQAQTKTLNGQTLCSTAVVSHPLWLRRFLVKADAFLDASNLSFSNKNNNNNNAVETMCFHVNEVLGVARHEPPEPPTPCRGGILADSMGLGKTVMLLALILASKQERKQQQKAGLAGHTKTTTTAPSTTLIVVKLSMLPQWQDEIQSKTKLTFSTYYGPGSNNATAVQEFYNVDIVLTTYGTIQGEAALRRATAKKQPLLLQHDWLRVILDEAHCIKNTSTLASKACCNLKAQYRWCVSGTIIQNSVEDLFGLLKFLHHEPWCLPKFWKAAITKPMLMTMASATTTAGDAAKNNNNSNQQDLERMAREREEAVRMVLGRLRRILAPIMLRRTKDSRTLDGKPILTLPPVETQVVHVNLLPAEREFYNAVLARSLTLFDSFVDSGTAAKSYLQILSMISRLRQTCDHIALTVRTRMEDEDWNAALFESNDDGSNDRYDGDGDDDGGKPRSKNISTPASKSSRSSGASNDVIGKQFLQGLLAKFCTNPSPRKKKERNDDSTADEESPDQKRPRVKATLYLSNVANALTDAVKAKSTHCDEECPICLEKPAIHCAVLTPCAHIFCRECLLGFLRENAKPQENGDGFAAPNKKSMVFHCPDGQCPCCSKQIQASRIVALSRSGPNGETLTSTYLTSMKPTSSSSSVAVPATTVNQTTMSQFSDSLVGTSRGVGPTKNDSLDNVATQACIAARTILDSTMKDVSSVESSKMQAVMQELDRVWQMDPGSKVIIFSQFLGFLDLMENRLTRVGIPFFRLDGKLSLKGRMNVLEHFRSCDDSDKVNNKNKMQLRKRNGASLVDTAAVTKTDNDEDTPDDNKNSVERGTVLLISMSAGGEGLNLVAASSVFLVDPWWNSAREDQCVNRIHRIGQKASVVRVRKFVTVDTVEESIVQLQSRKKYMADQVYNDNGTAGSNDDNDDGGGTARLNLDDFKLIFRKE